MLDLRAGDKPVDIPGSSKCLTSFCLLPLHVLMKHIHISMLLPSYTAVSNAASYPIPGPVPCHRDALQHSARGSTQWGCPGKSRPQCFGIISAISKCEISQQYQHLFNRLWILALKINRVFFWITTFINLINSGLNINLPAFSFSPSNNLYIVTWMLKVLEVDWKLIEYFPETFYFHFRNLEHYLIHSWIVLESCWHLEN